jgi:hypothetical protein
LIITLGHIYTLAMTVADIGVEAIKRFQLAQRQYDPVAQRQRSNWPTDSLRALAPDGNFEV